MEFSSRDMPHTSGTLIALPFNVHTWVRVRGDAVKLTPTDIQVFYWLYLPLFVGNSGYFNATKKHRHTNPPCATSLSLRNNEDFLDAGKGGTWNNGLYLPHIELQLVH